MSLPSTVTAVARPPMPNVTTVSRDPKGCANGILDSEHWMLSALPFRSRLTKSGDYFPLAISRTRGPMTSVRGVIPNPGSVEARMKPLSRCGAPAAALTVT